MWLLDMYWQVNFIQGNQFSSLTYTDGKWSNYNTGVASDLSKFTVFISSDLIVYIYCFYSIYVTYSTGYCIASALFLHANIATFLLKNLVYYT